MSAIRLYLGVAAPLFAAIGIAFLVAPAAMAGLSELDVATVAGAIEVRGYYGGQLLGIGALVALGAFRPSSPCPRCSGWRPRSVARVSGGSSGSRSREPLPRR